MKNLNAYIEQKNTWGSFFGSPAITFPLSQSDVESLTNSLDSDLSLRADPSKEAYLLPV